MSKTLETLKLELKQRMRSFQNNANILDGAVVGDLINVISEEIEKVYIENDALNLLYSVDNFSQLSDEKVDKIAANYLVYRKEAIFSGGIIKFIS